MGFFPCSTSEISAFSSVKVFLCSHDICSERGLVCGTHFKSTVYKSCSSSFMINDSITSGHRLTTLREQGWLLTWRNPLYTLQTSQTIDFYHISLFLNMLSTSICISVLLQNPNKSGFKEADSTEITLVAVTKKLYAARPVKLSLTFDKANNKAILAKSWTIW